MSRFRRRLMGLAALRQAKADDFVRVEYLENVSNAYIDTGIKGNNNIKIDAVILFNNTVAQFIYGSRRGDTMTASGNYGYLFYNDGTSYFGTCVGTIVTKNFDYIPKTNKKYHLNGTMRNLNIIFNDIDEETGEVVEKTINIVNSGTTPESSNDKNSYIFNINSRSGITVNNSFKGRVYSFKIYDGTTLVRDYIPMYQISTDTYGLWDRVEEKFYTSPNGVKFTGGERVIADNNDVIYYIKNYVSVNGNKYIDAQLKPNATDGWEADYYFNGTGRNYAWGAWSSSNSNSYGIRATASKIYFDYVTQAYVWSGTYGNKRMVIKADRNEFYINGVKKGQTTLKSGSAASRNFLIGNFNGSSYNGNGNLYWFKYWRNGELVRYYIPVQNVETKVYGLFDKVRNVCQYSSGSLALTGA